jgi:predicted ABC-type sugar transport system permease subunit
MTFEYIYTFFLTENNNSNVMRQELQDCVNSTGALFIYL